MSVVVFDDIQKELEKVNILIKEELQTDQNFLNQLVSHFTRRRGKMIRPSLVILGGKICGSKSKELLKLAAAMEILHMATLVHDDIIDEADKRRGGKNINSMFGSQLAVLLGDFFYARSLSIVNHIPHGYELISDIVASMVQGEFLQYETSFNLDQGKDNYLKIIGLKTAYFISTCCKLGALMGHSSKREEVALTNYGKYLGLAFQIRDDILDIYATEKKLGKPVYKDVTNGVYTLPILQALQSDRRDELSQILQKDFLVEEDLDDLNNIIIETGSLNYTHAKVLEYCEKARECLRIFPNSKEKSILISLTKFNMKRKY